MCPLMVNAALTEHGVEQFRDWALACESVPGAKPACRLYQKLALKDGMAPILVVSVVLDVSGTPRLHLTVPLGVSLAEGVELRTDRGEVRKAVYTHCTRNGCEADVAMDPGLLSAFRRGTRATTFIHHASKKRIGIPISLLGFTNAHRRLLENLQ
jgi:invasion protein IalB